MGKNKNLVKIIKIKRNFIDNFDCSPEPRLPKKGELYFLYETNDVSKRAGKEDFYYSDNPDWIENGMGGNMNSTVQRFHGWRGTTNDISTYALGVREFLGSEITIRTKTISYKLIFGPDLKIDKL